MRYEERGVYTSKSFVVNIPDDCGYEVRFEHNIDLRNEGVSATYIDWCVDNCFGKFGWWLDRSLAQNRFEKQIKAAIFVKIQQKFRKCRKICKILPNFKNFSLRIW